MKTLYDENGNPVVIPDNIPTQSPILAVTPPQTQPTAPILPPSTLAGVTPLSELKAYSEGVLIPLPEFGPDQPFVAKLKRPSITILMKSGKIPNSLMKTANELFAGEVSIDEENADGIKQLFDVLDIICEAAFVSPTYSQLKGEGITLTDEQYMFVFNYTQMGVKALTPFREESEDHGHNSNGDAVQGETLNTGGNT